MKQHPARYEGLELERGFAAAKDWWLIVPLLLGNRLSGFIVLQKPRVVPALNMEQLSSRTEEPAQEETDLHEALRRAVKRSEPRLPEPELHIGTEPILVHADPERLTVFEHLVRNAQDATGKDGRITLPLAG